MSDSVDSVTELFGAVTLSSPPDTVYINLYDILIIQKEPILFVGESPNRSYAKAVVLMRGSLDGIWATSLNQDPVSSVSEFFSSLEGLDSPTPGNSSQASMSSLLTVTRQRLLQKSLLCAK